MQTQYIYVSFTDLQFKGKSSDNAREFFLDNGVTIIRTPVCELDLDDPCQTIYVDNLSEHWQQDLVTECAEEEINTLLDQYDEIPELISFIIDWNEDLTTFTAP